MLLAVAFFLLKVHSSHQRRAAGVNFASGWSEPVRTQWRSCVDHSRRGDALLWRGLLPRRGQTAFTNGTQGHKGGKVPLNGSILFPAGAGCWLGVFERSFFARRKVENKTRRKRVGVFFCCCCCKSTLLSSHYTRIFFSGAPRSRLEWKTKILRTDRASLKDPENRQDEQFHGTCRVVVGNPEKIYVCGYLPQACPWINSQTWMKNCGSWRTLT